MNERHAIVRRQALSGLSLTEVRAVQLDEKLVRLARGRGGVDLAIGETLVELSEGDRLIRLGFSRIVDYARERLGIPARTAFFFTRLARGLASRSLLRRAVVAGSVSPRKAMTVMSAAVGEDESAWVAAAMSMPLGELERLVRGAGKGSASDSFEVESLVLRMSGEQQDRLDAAMEVARGVIGYGSPRHQLIESMAQEWLGTFGEFAEDACAVGLPSGAGSGDPIRKWRDSERGVRRQISLVEEASEVVEGAGEALPHRPAELDALALRLMEARRGFDEPFGKVAVEFFRYWYWRSLGFRSRGEYCRERLGMSERSVRQRVWLEHRMEFLPPLRVALASGRVTYSKALIVAKDASAGDVEARIAGVASTTWQQAERASTDREDRQNRAAGIRRVWGPRESAETIAMAIACAQAFYAARGDPISAGEALARMADHFALTWSPLLKRMRIPARRREVMLRNGGLCAWPGCSREAVHDHHIEFRSNGGSDEVSNRAPLCAVHHLRGIHKGYLELVGTAGEELRFRARGPLRRLVQEWRMHGRDDVRRVRNPVFHYRTRVRVREFVTVCAAAT